MADVNITIPTPIIVTPGYFRVRYRDVTTSTWTTIADQTNAPFTITGVPVGDWELGVTYVNAEGHICEEVLYPFEVAPPCECLDITDVSVQREVPGGPAYLKIYYTAPVNLAACGYIVRYAQHGLPPALTGKATVYFPTLPTPPIKVPVPGLVDLDVEVLADCCEGNVSTCYEGAVIADGEPASGCVGVSTTNTLVQIVKSSSTGQYIIRITFPGPPEGPVPSLCAGMYIVATQIGVMASGFGGFGGIRGRPGELVTIYLPPTDFYAVGTAGKQIAKPLHPSPDVDYLGIRYSVALHDCCGNIVYFASVVFGGIQIP